MEERAVCRTWGKYMYWNHFRSVGFFRILTGDFSTQLAIPKRFYHNMRGKLPSRMTLKGRSGATWNVQLIANSGALLIQDGWEDFVRAYSLKDHDMLVFNYNIGNSWFDVLIYDGKTSCEKEMSYFVKHVGSSGWSRKTSTHNEKKRRSSTRDYEPPTTMKNSKRADVGECSTRNISEQISSSSQEIQILSDADAVDDEDCGSDRTWRNKIVNKSERGKAGVSKRGEQSTARRRKINGEGTSGGQEGCFSGLNPSPSIRKPATEEQKVEALEKARKSLSSTNSFYVVIRTYHVTRGQLCFPARWVRKYLRPRHQYLFIQYKGDKWRFRYNTRSCGGVIVSGWREFVLAHSIQEFDVCVFMFSRQRHDDCVVLDVLIHYAGDWVE